MTVGPRSDKRNRPSGFNPFGDRSISMVLLDFSWVTQNRRLSTQAERWLPGLATDDASISFMQKRRLMEKHLVSYGAQPPKKAVGPPDAIEDYYT